MTLSLYNKYETRNNYMDEPEKKEQNLRMAAIKPSVLLAGNYPRLIDEWQSAPTLWDSIRFSALMHFKVIK